MKLLSREQFRTLVFQRDNNLCVLCKAPAADAHHLLERRIWSDGGYYVDNGASVCSECHIRCESTEVSVEQLREAAGIKNIVLPEHLYRDQRYDKWANPILPDGRRLRGELSDDLSVQKILGTTAIQWANRIKYPRTWHLPWSPGATKDDRLLKDTTCFEDFSVVITAKMDGENTTMYPDGLHARSLEYSPHESRNLIKAEWARICGDIPEGFRICGENLYARHSVRYENLTAYFQVFSIWDGLTCLDWDSTLEWCALLGLTPVPTIYYGAWDEKMARGIKQELTLDEGYVVRKSDRFHYREFSQSVAKFVRPGHVAGSHWKSRAIEQNLLEKK